MKESPIDLNFKKQKDLKIPLIIKKRKIRKKNDVKMNFIKI